MDSIECLWEIVHPDELLGGRATKQESYLHIVTANEQQCVGVEMNYRTVDEAV